MIITGTVVLICCAVLANRGWRLVELQQAHQARVVSVQLLADRASEIMRRRSTIEAAIPAAAPADAIAGLVEQIARDSAIPSSSIGRVSAVSESTGGRRSGDNGVSVGKQRFDLSFTAVTLGSLGDFLASWQAAAPRWVPARVRVAIASGVAPVELWDVELSLEAEVVSR